MCKDENYCIYVAVEDKQVVVFIGLHSQYFYLKDMVLRYPNTIKSV